LKQFGFFSNPESLPAVGRGETILITKTHEGIKTPEG